MLLGAAVLLMRTRAVISHSYRKKARIFHILLLVGRFAVGAVDVGLLQYGMSQYETCLYKAVFFVSMIVYQYMYDVLLNCK